MTAYNLVRPLPLSKVVNLNAAFELICVLVNLGLIHWFRTRAVHPRWPRAFVVIIAAVGVVGTTVYYFTTFCRPTCLLR